MESGFPRSREWLAFREVRSPRCILGVNVTGTVKAGRETDKYTKYYFSHPLPNIEHDADGYNIIYSIYCIILYIIIILIYYYYTYVCVEVCV